MFRVLTLLLTLTFTLLLVSTTFAEYITLPINLVSTANNDYASAVGSDLLEVAHGKSVTWQWEIGPPCTVGYFDFYIPIGNYEKNKVINANSSTTATSRERCKAACDTWYDNRTDITPPESRRQLENGENVVLDNLDVNTYVLAISPQR